MNLARALCVLSALALSACASSPPPPAPPPQLWQEVEFRVLDTQDRPVAGARVHLIPQAGRPEVPGPLMTDAKGGALVKWAPRAEDATGGASQQDRNFQYVTRLKYQVEAPGFFTGSGSLQGGDIARDLASPELKGLDRQAVLARLTGVMVLHREKDLWSGELAQRPHDDPLAAKLVAFRARLAPVAVHLGAEFAWPAFGLAGGRLTVRFNWLDQAWASLGVAPLKARVTASTALPLALACGQDLLPLAGVEHLILEILAPQGAATDPHAALAQGSYLLSAPARDYLALASGELSAEELVNRNPPSLVRDDRAAKQRARERQDLWGPGLAQGKATADLRKKLTAWLAQGRAQALTLGAALATPAFSLKDDTLGLRFDWVGASWQGLEPPALARMLVITVMVPLGRDMFTEKLLPLKDVKRLSMSFFSQVTPKGDPHAMATPTSLVVTATMAQLQDLGLGKLPADKFLAGKPYEHQTQSPQKSLFPDLKVE